MFHGPWYNFDASRDIVSPFIQRGALEYSWEALVHLPCNADLSLAMPLL